VGESVQTLNDLQYLWGSLQEKPSPYTVGMIVARLPKDPEQARRFLWGKHGAINKALFECDSRSGAYELYSAGKLGSVLKGLGLVKDVPRGWRDALTGRRVTTRLRELSRLSWEWETEAGKDWLRTNWPEIMGLTTDELKQWVRGANPRARGAGDPEQG
jgi:hypothetical protein